MSASCRGAPKGLLNNGANDGARGMGSSRSPYLQNSG